MRSKKTENVEGSSRKQGSSRKVASLDSRYGEIGISAVAAALQYSGDVKSAIRAYLPAGRPLARRPRGLTARPGTQRWRCIAPLHSPGDSAHRTGSACRPIGANLLHDAA